MTQCDERVSVSPAPIRGRLATWLGAPRYGHVTCARSFPLSLFPSSLQTGFSLMLSRVRGGWVQDVCLCVWRGGGPGRVCVCGGGGSEFVIVIGACLGGVCDCA